MNTHNPVGGGDNYPNSSLPNSQFEQFNDTDSYEDGSGRPNQSRQSNSIGIVNRSTRMMAQQNYRVSQGKSRKSNTRSIYDGSETPNGVPMPARGTTTDRSQRQAVKAQVVANGPQ